MLITRAKKQYLSHAFESDNSSFKNEMEGNTVKKHLFPKREFFVLKSTERYSGKTRNMCCLGRFHRR